MAARLFYGRDAVGAALLAPPVRGLLLLIQVLSTSKNPTFNSEARITLELRRDIFNHLAQLGEPTLSLHLQRTILFELCLQLFTDLNDAALKSLGLVPVDLMPEIVGGHIALMKQGLTPATPGVLPGQRADIHALAVFAVRLAPSQADGRDEATRRWDMAKVQRPPNGSLTAYGGLAAVYQKYFDDLVVAQIGMAKQGLSVSMDVEIYPLSLDFIRCLASKDHPDAHALLTLLAAFEIQQDLPGADLDRYCTEAVRVAMVALLKNATAKAARAAASPGVGASSAALLASETKRATTLAAENLRLHNELKLSRAPKAPEVPTVGNKANGVSFKAGVEAAGREHGLN